LVLLALVGIAAVVLLPGWATIALAVTLLVALVIVDLALAASPRAALLSRSLPSSVRLGEEATAVLTVHNAGGRPMRALVKEGWQPSAGAADPRGRLTVPAGGRARLDVRLRPTRRGALQVSHTTIRSYGPLGLAARQHTAASPERILVLPPFRSRRHLPSKLRKLRELDGRAAVQIRGAGTEFDSLRDYVRGDDVRSIDWRATARRQGVVVRTWRPERDRRIVIVLDTSRTSAGRIMDEPRLDTGIESALLLAVLAERGGDRVDFLAFDRRVRAQASSGGPGTLLASMVAAMAALQPELIELDWAQLPARVRAVTAHRSLIVLLTALDSGAAEEGLIPLVEQLAQRHVVVVASVLDPELNELRHRRRTSSDVYRAAAAERALLDRAAVAAQLRRFGAEVVDAEPNELPPRLADMYIRLKAAGRL
jgi:uncharacterized protein (DUF58 family)